MPLPAATKFRPWPIRAANALLPRAWATGALPRVDLSEATLDAQARAQTGLSEFGDDAFSRAQLRVLLTALREEARLHPVGELIAHGSLLKVLKERLWAQALFTRHPEILDRPVVAPVVIVGQMRSGTTRIQRLLACDPRFAALRLYEAMCPVPWPSSVKARDTGRHDPRIGYTRNGLRLLNWLNPEIARIHPTGALAVDEELGLFEHSFTGAQIEAQRRVPSFARYGESHDQTPAYVELRRLLQLANWFRGDDASKPWLLKTPQHMQDLPALLRVFPAARLIFTQRDPQDVVPSGASLAYHQMVVQSDHVDANWVGAEWLHKAAYRAEAAATARRHIPAQLQHEVDYAAVDTDWRREVQRIYAFLDCELPPTVMAAMAAYMAEPVPPRAQRATASDFGLSPALIAARFAGLPAPALSPVAASPAAATTAPAGRDDVRGDSRRSESRLRPRATG